MLITKDWWPTYVGEVILVLSGRLTGVSIGDYVEVKVGEPIRTSRERYLTIMTQGYRSRIRPINGDAGHGARIINSENKTSQRRITENQYATNKEILVRA